MRDIQRIKIKHFLILNTNEADLDCVSNCNRESVQCEQGCPDETSCDVTFLVLNSYYAERAELFTWQLGTDQRTEKATEFTEFYTDGTSADTSCSIVFKGQMYIIGGQWWPRQVTMVDGCQLTPVF